MTLRKYNTDELCLFDDVFFRACFDGHPECTAELLKVILGMPNIRIIDHEVQKIIGNDKYHGVRLDVYAVNEDDNSVYNIEIQKTDDTDIVRRSRYYSSIIDSRTTIRRNEEYGRIPDTYVIIICRDDIIKQGRAIYHFKMRTDDNTDLNDGRNTLFVNGSYEGDDDIGKLISDLIQKDTKRINNGILAKRIAEVKEGEKSMVETSFDRYLKEEKQSSFAEGREEGRAEGLTKGRAEGREEGLTEGRSVESIDTVKRMLAKGKLSIEEIAEYSDLPVDKVRELAAGA